MLNVLNHIRFLMRQIFPDKWRRTPTNLFASHLRGQLLKLSHEIRLDSRFLGLHLYSKSILEHNSAPFNYIKSQKYLLTLQINSLTLCGLNPTCNSLCRLGTCGFLAQTKYYPSSPPHKKTPNRIVCFRPRSYKVHCFA